LEHWDHFNHLTHLTLAPAPTSLRPAIDAGALRRKVAWRVLPFVFLLYIVAYLDRANVGFAKLAMVDDLKFSEAVFGFGFGIFFIGYLILEIPGALLVERWSARKWFARILISWGMCSALTAFVQTPRQFYVARFLLGVAEAGFFPGIIVYFTHWFAARDRARALAGLVMAVPFSLALGAPVSALLLQGNWFGITGWKWMFLLEGLPAVVLGLVTLFFLTDRPRDAKWLTPDERDWLTAQLEAEANAKKIAGDISVWQALRLRNVWLLALGIFATNTGGYAFTFWLPTAIKGISRGSTASVLWWSGLVYACGLVSVFLSGQSSDRTGDRKWHCVAGQVFTAVFLSASTIPGQPFWMVLTWLCLTGFAGYFWPSPFWALPTMTLTASAAAVSIAFINMGANVAGSLGNYSVGQLKSHGFGDPVCLLFLAVCYLVGGVIISFLRIPPTLACHSKSTRSFRPRSTAQRTTFP
jgi:MFS transporter, ACS family, tartrate transporter